MKIFACIYPRISVIIFAEPKEDIRLMNPLALTTLVIGVLAICLRGPMILFPKTVAGIFQKLIKSPASMQAMGFVFSVLGFLLAFFAWGEPGLAARVMLALGLIWGLVSLIFLVFFPSLYRSLALFFLDLDTSVLRMIGVLGVALGAILVYLGLVVFL